MSTGKVLRRVIVPALIAGTALSAAACASVPSSASTAAFERHRPHPSPVRSTPSTAPVTATPASSPSSSPVVTTSSPTAPSPSGTSAGTPLPAALQAGHPLVRTFSPSTLATTWSKPSNDPGNCASPNSSAHVNAAGYAEIDTTGANGDCVSLQSPGTLPTSPGYVYEAVIDFSSFQDWPAYWGYGVKWPQDGEADVVEGGPGDSFVTWHEDRDGIANYTIGNGSWNNQVVATTGAPNIAPGTWTTVDMSFTATGTDVYYNGLLYVHLPETVTAGGNDPFYVTVSEGSCDADGVNVCNGGTAPAGSVQVKSITEFS